MWKIEDNEAKGLNLADVLIENRMINSKVYEQFRISSVIVCWVFTSGPSEMK